MAGDIVSLVIRLYPEVAQHVAKLEAQADDLEDRLNRVIEVLEAREAMWRAHIANGADSFHTEGDSYARVMELIYLQDILKPVIKEREEE